MFESTLEAQGLNVGERRLGTLSAAALVHVGIGLAIVAATAFIVPPIRTPEPAPEFAIISMRPMGEATPKAAPAPRKGVETAKPGRTLTPPPVPPDVPPVSTPSALPTPEPDPVSDGPDIPGEGTPGVPDGSLHGVPGGTGVDDGGGDGVGDGPGADPLVLTGDMVRPVLLEKIAPSYPLVARKAGLGGRVTVRAVIAPDGSVESVEVLSSTNPIFNEAAVEAVRQWRYRPALMNGKPVRVYFSVLVDFIVR